MRVREYPLHPVITKQREQSKVIWVAQGQKWEAMVQNTPVRPLTWRRFGIRAVGALVSLRPGRHDQEGLEPASSNHIGNRRVARLISYPPIASDGVRNHTPTTARGGSKLGYEGQPTCVYIYWLVGHFPQFNRLVVRRQ